MQLETLGTRPPTIDLGTHVVRPLRPADAPVGYASLSDPAVTRLTSCDVASLERVARFIAAYDDGYVERISHRRAIADKASDLPLGTCGFSRWDARNARAELGYDLAKAYWGRGIMTEDHTKTGAGHVRLVLHVKTCPQQQHLCGSLPLLIWHSRMHFPGAVVLVSHNRFLIDKVATRLLVFESDRHVREIDGNWTPWQVGSDHAAKEAEGREQ